jgi:6-phosphogluconolactonase (cycloisomerase 2 family)
MKKILMVACVVLSVWGCKKNNGVNGKTSEDVIYLENNDFHDNQNAILAYRKNDDGTLSALAGSPFYTGGSGIANPTQGLGPDDSDDQLVISNDGNFLLAVNPGSNTIAVFQIRAEGNLSPVPGSPFPSGGQTPVSINIRGKYVFVANQGGDPLHPSTENPSYTTLTVDGDGQLVVVPGAKFETTPGSSPSMALVSENGKFLFGSDFLGFMLTPPVGSLRSFNITGGGNLQPVSGTPYTIPGTGGALGLWQHPHSNILYAGFPVQAKIGIYTINESTGELSFQSAIDAGPAACWLRTTKSGHYLYSLNSGENSISVFDASNASSPSTTGKIVLKQSGPDYMAMGKAFPTSQDFALAFSPDEKYLYVISQSTNPDFSIGNYNYLHVLMVGENGLLSEPMDPLQLPVDASFRPQGLAVVASEFMNQNTKMK